MSNQTQSGGLVITRNPLWKEGEDPYKFPIDWDPELDRFRISLPLGVTLLQAAADLEEVARGLRDVARERAKIAEAQFSIHEEMISDFVEMLKNELPF